ncbi:Short-chain dehydrogenase [Caloranaerobacter azorensis DSM 13643]|uniref:Short-chain dehydrogenase n=1 Tax=Caloranaerobacter azorensis DSM 13643 TaxID=1121264 RepID=A0A1M5RW08_9FIRM|nr:SDR family oxidoreductase [Caloranaerobacter azorensis]SHH30341.1 Short-chain dehydrogenase [Caloranaerobacter azorensis DSM 13643]
MEYIYGKVALVVGASSGMGKACAEYLKKHGYIVYGTSRKAIFPDSLTKNREGTIQMIPLDVTQEKSIKEAIDYIVKNEGQINILLNCAGYALGGAVEDISNDEAHEIFDTNFFGMMSVIRHVLPIMRKQNKGLIVNISSVAGFIALPFQSMYSATKYAVEAMTECLRMEVKPFGIKVSIIEPGDIKTNFTSSRKTAKAALINPAYKERHKKAVETMIKDELNGPGPQIVVKAFAKILNSKNPPVRIVVGFKYKCVALLKRILPSRVVEHVLEKIY